MAELETERDIQRQFTQDVDRLIETLEKTAAAAFGLVESIQAVADHLFEITVEVRGIRNAAYHESVDRTLARNQIKRAMDKARGLRE